MSKKLGRLEKRNAEFFSHYVHSSKTIRLLQSKYGNDGYAVWFKLLELCTHADEHLGDLKDEISVLDFLDYALVDEITLNSIIKFLIKLDQIDEGIWVHSRKIWIQGLADNLKPLYDKRIGDVPVKPVLTLPDPEGIVSVTERAITDTESNKKDTFRHCPSPTDPETPQSKGEVREKRKEEEINTVEKTSKAELSAQKESSLYNSIWKTFLSKNDNQFTDYPKEGKAVNALIKKAETRFPEDPGSFIQLAIETYYNLINGNDKFWNKHPFIPSSLNSSGIWDRVLVEMKEQEVDLEPISFEIQEDMIF